MNNINYLNLNYKDIDSFKAKCKIRYRQADQDCEVIKLEDDLYEVKFDEKQRAIAI